MVGGLGVFAFGVLPCCPLIAWKSDQKQRSKASEPGNGCGKARPLVQKLRTGAAKQQRTRISVQIKAGWLDFRGHREAASANRSDLQLEPEGFDSRQSGRQSGFEVGEL